MTLFVVIHTCLIVMYPNNQLIDLVTDFCYFLKRGIDLIYLLPLPFNRDIFIVCKQINGLIIIVCYFLFSVFDMRDVITFAAARDVLLQSVK